MEKTKCQVLNIYLTRKARQQYNFIYSDIINDLLGTDNDGHDKGRQ